MKKSEEKKADIKEPSYSFTLPPSTSSVDAQIYGGLAMFNEFTIRRIKAEEADETYQTLVASPKRLYEKENFQLIFESHNLRSSQVIPCMVYDQFNKPCPRIAFAIQQPPPEPDYIPEMYNQFIARSQGQGESAEKRAKQAKDEYDHSFLTCGDTEKIINALKLLLHDQVQLNVKEDLLFVALRMAFQCVGYDMNMLEPPDFLYIYDHMHEIKVPDMKASGLMPSNSHVTTIGDLVIKVGSNSDKRTAKLEAIMRIKCMFERLWAKFKGRHPTWEEIWDAFNTEIAIVTFKVEAKGQTDDKNKIRIYFIASLVDFLLAKMVFEPFFKTLRRCFGHSIGFKWMKGDAFRMYNTFSQFQKMFYGDWSRFDMSLKAALLGFICSAFVYFVKRPVERERQMDYYMYICILMYLVSRITVKIVQWFDRQWRIVIGQMHSGQYETSYFNTIYALITIFYEMMDAAKDAGAAEYLRTQFEVLLIFVRMINMASSHKLKDTPNLIPPQLDFWIQDFGDDFAFAMKGRMLTFFSLYKLVRGVTVHFFMTIKYSNCAECDTVLSKLDTEGNLQMRTWTDPDGIDHQRPHGLKYLKRYFIMREVRNQYIIVPYRPIEDYMIRVGRTPTKLMDPTVQLYRLHGLIKDNTLGNGFAIEMLWTFVELLHEQFPHAAQKLAETNEHDMTLDMRNLMDKYMHKGIANMKFEDLIRGPNLEMDLKNYMELLSVIYTESPTLGHLFNFRRWKIPGWYRMYNSYS